VDVYARLVPSYLDSGGMKVEIREPTTRDGENATAAVAPEEVEALDGFRVPARQPNMEAISDVPVGEAEPGGNAGRPHLFDSRHHHIIERAAFISDRRERRREEGADIRSGRIVRKQPAVGD